jgi:hypothetical protein
MNAITNVLHIEALLDRLDPRLDEPCTVSECTHEHECRLGARDVVAGLRAA